MDGLIYPNTPKTVTKYCMAGSIGMELNLAVGKINCMSPNFVLPTFNTCIKTLNAYILILKHVF